MPLLPTLAAATSTLTGSAFADTETVTIGGKVYTFQASLTNVDGHVYKGANDTAALANLKKAINLTGTAGTDYATAMTKHTMVKAVSSDATTLVIEALIKGTLGNQILTSETCASASWTSTRMGSGSGSFSGAVDDVRTYGQLNSDVEQALNAALNF